ncbi:MAG: low-specificity L-threonine aldolase [Anaerolineales bacterium]|jgi:threonine aldolase|nr:low-specificity L-threonine aldolase [Anaerolineales bacterium]MDX9936390.1 low-specificity L-threonine aldolase [Anaerolineales bacterium]GER80212.1 low-specificity L-threonine aldolase [Candidatus Denitrolinea symbiosum]
MNPTDLRSDTLTHPTPAMREAMAKAPVGDDVYAEDPTVNRLQELAAARTGKEAALYVPSGAMGNLASILAHCQRGDEVMLGDKSHTFLYEAGGISALGGIHSRQLPNQPDGSLLLSDLEAGLRGTDSHYPPSRLISLENTHNRCGGVFQPPRYFQQVGEFAQQHGLKIHLDGARIFNAAAAQNVDVKAFAQHVDSLTFCLSKGLAAPVGSVICGTREFIQRAHRQRKLLGGGMRQAGILAAAGIVALETMVDRLSEDHARARALAQRLEKMRGLIVNTSSTNMVFVSLADSVPLSAKEVAEKLKALGVLVGVTDSRQFRLVTHYEVNDADVERAASAFAEVLQA